MPALHAVCRIHKRQEDRKVKAAASKQAEKLGYTPRNRAGNGPTQSGMSSAGMLRGKPQDELDDESAAGLAKVKAQDAEIDAGLDTLCRTMDNLSGIASAMRDEAVTQTTKLDLLDNQMEKTMQKQTVVNARQRHLLK